MRAGERRVRPICSGRKGNGPPKAGTGLRGDIFGPRSRDPSELSGPMGVATLSFRGSQCLRREGSAEAFALREARHPTSPPGPQPGLGFSPSVTGLPGGDGQGSLQGAGRPNRRLHSGGRAEAPGGASSRRAGVDPDGVHGGCADASENGSEKPRGGSGRSREGGAVAVTDALGKDEKLGDAPGRRRPGRAQTRPASPEHGGACPRGSCRGARALSAALPRGPDRRGSLRPGRPAASEEVGASRAGGSHGMVTRGHHRLKDTVVHSLGSSQTKI